MKFKYQKGGTFKSDINTDQYKAIPQVMRTGISSYLLGNNQSNLDKEKNLNFGRYVNSGYFKEVDDSKEKKYLNDWYSNPQTLKRIGQNTGRAIPENLRRGTFINQNSKSYLYEAPSWYKSDSNGFDAYWRDGINDPQNRLNVYTESTNKPIFRIHENNHHYQDLHKDLFKNNKAFQQLEGDKYHRNPTEIHSRLMEIRYFLNKKPGQIITPEEYQKAKNGLKEPNGKPRDIKDYNDDDMLNWLNTIAMNNKIKDLI